MKPSFAIAFFQSMGIPAPVAEYKFHPVRKWRMDYAWPEHKVALEVEGGVWTGGRHTRPMGFLADCEKYNAAAVLGWRILRCQPSKLATTSTAETIKAAISFCSS
jgi:very-short-patch-repair endonuclease